MRKVITAAEFGRLPPGDHPRELIAGSVVERPIPFPFYGFVCGKVARCLANFVDAADLGRGKLRSGVITNCDPDTVRNADVNYYSFARLPRRRLPDDRYFDVRPEVGRRSASLAGAVDEDAVAEFLNAGVEVVCVIDLTGKIVTLFREERPPEHIPADADLVLPDVLPGFRVPLRHFLE